MIGQTYKWLEQEVNLIKEKGLYRQLRSISPSNSSNKANVDGVEYLMASSNNYLGLAGDKRLVDTAIMTLKKYGVGSTGSRLTTGNTNLHEKLEKRIADFKMDEAAIVFSSGYLANIGTVSSLAGKGCLLT